jgi:hypothetical protein
MLAEIGARALLPRGGCRLDRHVEVEGGRSDPDSSAGSAAGAVNDIPRPPLTLS